MTAPVLGAIWADFPDNSWGWIMARILLAEDDESLRRFLAKALEKAGHEVQSYGDGLAAADALNGNEFDLLLADIVMPGLDGIELAQRATNDDPDLKVVLITGFTAVALRARSAKLSRAKVLSKPIHLRDLVDQIEDVLAA